MNDVDVVLLHFHSSLFIIRVRVIEQNLPINLPILKKYIYIYTDNKPSKQRIIIIHYHRHSQGFLIFLLIVVPGLVLRCILIYECRFNHECISVFYCLLNKMFTMLHRYTVAVTAVTFTCYSVTIAILSVLFNSNLDCNSDSIF